jgi:hypothetical protein
MKKMKKYKAEYEIRYDDDEGGQSDMGSIFVKADDRHSAKAIAVDLIFADEAQYGGYISDLMISEVQQKEVLGTTRKLK